MRRKAGIEQLGASGKLHSRTARRYVQAVGTGLAVDDLRVPAAGPASVPNPADELARFDLARARRAAKPALGPPASQALPQAKALEDSAGRTTVILCGLLLVAAFFIFGSASTSRARPPVGTEPSVPALAPRPSPQWTESPARQTVTKGFPSIAGHLVIDPMAPAPPAIEQILAPPTRAKPHPTPRAARRAPAPSRPATPNSPLAHSVLERPIAPPED